MCGQREHSASPCSSLCLALAEGSVEGSVRRSTLQRATAKPPGPARALPCQFEIYFRLQKTGGSVTSARETPAPAGPTGPAARPRSLRIPPRATRVLLSQARSRAGRASESRAGLSGVLGRLPNSRAQQVTLESTFATTVLPNTLHPARRTPDRHTLDTRARAFYFPCLLSVATPFFRGSIF